MESVLGALATALTFEGLIRTLELAVLVYMLRVLYDVKNKVDRLHDWHEPEDPNSPGRKIWWSDPSVAASLEAIVENGRTANDHLHNLELSAAKASRGTPIRGTA